MLSNSSRWIKYLLFFFNVIFVITGIVLISVGATILGYYRQYDLFIEPRYFSAAELIMAVGAIVMIVASFGCCGAIKEHYCMTMTFACILIFICILELGVGVAGYMLRNEAASVIEKSMKENLKEAKMDQSKMLEWDKLQQEFICCGAANYTDWYNGTDETVPSSCCEGGETCVPEKAFKEGCIKKFGDYLTDHTQMVGGFGIGIAFIQSVGIVLSLWLAKAIRSEYEAI